MSKKLGIYENIKFLGYRKDIPQLLKISNLYVSTSKQEGLPVNIMEAMICGLPIIATNCRGNRDLIKNGENGFLINNTNIEYMEKTIIKVKESTEYFIKQDSKQLEKYLICNVKKQMERIYKLV